MTDTITNNFWTNDPYVLIEKDNMKNIGQKKT